MTMIKDKNIHFYKYISNLILWMYRNISENIDGFLIQDINDKN